jgi:hypothetical protein
MPASYIGGELTSAMSDTGKADAKAVDRGLKVYYFSIIKPVVDTLFNISTTYKSDNTEELTLAFESLKTFDITSDEYLSKENKLKVSNKLFGLPEDTEGGEPDPVVDLPATNFEG